MRERGSGPKRIPSGTHRIDPDQRTDDRLYAIATHYERWSSKTTKAALALPADTCRSVAEWVRKLDEIERTSKRRRA